MLVPPPPDPPPAITRVAGTHPATGIVWTLITLEGTRTPVLPGAPPPRLTIQCSQSAAHGMRLELLVTDPAASSPDAPAFQPPWQRSPGVLFAPTLQKVQVTMEFLGYTHVKPVHRQWEHPDNTSGLLRYSTPGARSSNMEPISFYLQYLRALPTLRLTLPDGSAEQFETTALQQAVHAEPLCKLSDW